MTLFKNSLLNSKMSSGQQRHITYFAPIFFTVLLVLNGSSASGQTPTPTPGGEEIKLQEEKRGLELKKDIELAKKAIRDAQPQPAQPTATPLMQTAELLLKFMTALAWPVLAVFFLVRYREALLSLMAQGKVKFEMAGVTVETSLAKFERIMTDSMRGRDLSRKQWQYLEGMADSPMPFIREEHYDDLQPMRNAGLIWAIPDGHLGSAKQVTISPLGRLLLEARSKQQPRTKEKNDDDA